MEHLHEPPAILKAIVERRRRNPHHIRPPLIDHNAALLKRLHHPLQQPLLQPDTNLRAPLRRAPRRKQHVRPAPHPTHVPSQQQPLEVRRQADALRAQPVEPCLGEHRQARQHAGGVQHAGIAELPAGGASHGAEGGLHAEARALRAAPPPGQAAAVAQAGVDALRRVFGGGGAFGGRGHGAVARVHEGGGDGAGPAVQVLVRAPRREVDVPGVQAQRHVAGRVRQVPAHRDAARLREGRDRRDVEGLPRVEVHAREEEERGGGGVLRDQRLDVGGAVVVHFGVGGLHDDQRGGRVEVVMVELGVDGILRRVSKETRSRFGLASRWHIRGHLERPCSR